MSASTVLPFANVTRAVSAVCSKPTPRWSVLTTPGGSDLARNSIRSARCIPNVAFQPDESVTCTGAIGEPSLRKKCDFGPTREPHFSTSPRRPTRCNCRTLFGVRYTPAPISPSAGACSYTDTLCPVSISALAVNRPAIPPPTITTLGRAFAITILLGPKSPTCARNRSFRVCFEFPKMRRNACGFKVRVAAFERLQGL